MVDIETINRDDIGREYVLCFFKTRGYFISIRANKTYSGKNKTQETLDQEAIDIINKLWKSRPSDTTHYPFCNVWDCDHNVGGACEILTTEKPMMEFTVTQCTENKNAPYLGHLKKSVEGYYGDCIGCGAAIYLKEDENGELKRVRTCDCSSLENSRKT